MGGVKGKKQGPLARVLAAIRGFRSSVAAEFQASGWAAASRHGASQGRFDEVERRLKDLVIQLDRVDLHVINTALRARVIQVAVGRVEQSLARIEEELGTQPRRELRRVALTLRKAG